MPPPHYAGRGEHYPWRCLNLGFFLQITYKRPLRRTILQSADRFFKDALVFIKKHTLKNLYNGNLADEENTTSSKKNHQKTSASKPSDPLKRIMEKEKVTSKDFVIVRYKNKTSYLTRKNDIKEITKSYDFSPLGQ